MYVPGSQQSFYSNKNKSSQLDDHLFRDFRDLIYSESRINLTKKKKLLLTSRLIKRLNILGIENFADYYSYLIKNEDIDLTNLPDNKNQESTRESQG